MLGPLHKTMQDLLSGRDWVYLLGLLVPLTLYDLALKAASIAAQDEERSLVGTLNLMRSDILFGLGYALFWIGLFAMTHRGALRRLVVVLFHVVSLVVVVIATVAYQYFEATGSTLDYNVLAFYLGTLGEVKDIIASEAPWYVWCVLAVALLYVVLGPWALTRLTGWRTRGSPVRRTSRIGAVGLCLIAIGFGSLALVPGAADANRAFSLSPLVNVFLTGVATPGAEEIAVDEASASIGRTLRDAKLRETFATEKRNVVVILLESTRHRSTTPYNEEIDTTPFLDELAKESLLVERAYTTIPHTSKAITSVYCGIYPHPETDIHEAEPGNIPVRCLPELLTEQGYNSVFFQSATETFEDRPQLVENFGYEDFYGLGDMSREGFERAGYLGFEDDIMLDPSRTWLENNGDEGPFLATYLTITPHHEWLAPDRYGFRDYGVEDDNLNRYLNTVHYVDRFVENVIEQYKDLGLYEETVFIIVGDHGEGFAEHGVRGHDNVIHDEGLRVPLVIHDPRPSDDGERIEGPTNHMDLPPTILDILNYRVVHGEYPGTSILDPPEDRTLFFSCRPEPLCMASIKGYEKFIYHYDKQPAEFYDLSEDPLERNNIADEIPAQELNERRDELLEWRANAAALYDEAPPRPE